jgi:hypothetical protein
MQAIMTIGLDLAKSIFQVHGIDAAGNVVVRRQLKRRANPEPSTHGTWPTSNDVRSSVAIGGIGDIGNL